MEIIRSNPNILGGVPCFAGTRVPASFFFEYLREGYTIGYFLSQYPSVRREQIDALLAELERPFAVERRAAG